MTDLRHVIRAAEEQAILELRNAGLINDMKIAELRKKGVLSSE